MSEKIEMEFAGRVAESDSYGRYYSENYALNGSPKEYELEAIFRNPQSHVDDIYYLAKYYYAKVGIIMRVVNIIRDFGMADFDLVYTEKVPEKAKEIIENFNERINMKQVLRDILFELALSGNVAGYDREGRRIDIYPIHKIEVTPLIVNNQPVLMYKNPLNLQNVTELPQAVQRKLLQSYPKELAKGLRKNEEKIVLDVTKTFFHKVNSSRYEPYGIPHILTAFDELAHKTVLKEAERSTATAIIEKILRISVGDKDNKPKQPHIDFYSNLIENKKGSIKVTVPYFVNMEYIEPATDIFGKEKFEQVDLDILNALGISLTLIRGEGGGNYSEGFLSMTGLIKTVEHMREGVPAIIKGWYRAELERNGIDPDSAPDFVLKPIEIDQSAKMEMLRFMFQSAGLPYEIFYSEAGYDYDHVKLTRKAENDEKVEDLFKLRQQPFQGAGAGVDPNNKGGAPQKSLSDRKSDKAQSNNKQPRPSTTK